MSPSNLTGWRAKPGFGATPGMIRRCRSGSWTALFSTPRFSPPRPAIVLPTAVSTAGKALAVAREPAATSISMPTRWRGCFPTWSATTREKVDFGLAQQPDGAIHFRGEFNNFPAIDAQSGTILRALREHQMSADGEFLQAQLAENQAGHAMAHRQRRRTATASSKATSTTRSIPIGLARWRG